MQTLNIHTLNFFLYFPKFLVKDAIKRMDLVGRSELEELQSKQVSKISELQQRIDELEAQIK